jgi:hypothetical protein
MPEKNILKEDKFILAHGFGSFSPWPADSIACRPMPRQNIIEEKC